MEKANQIKAYEEVSKAFTDILRNSLDDEFRFQFYSLLNVIFGIVIFILEFISKLI